MTTFDCVLWGFSKIGITFLGGILFYLGYKRGTPSLGKAHMTRSIDQYVSLWYHIIHSNSSYTNDNAKMHIIADALRMRLVCSSFGAPEILGAALY